MPFLHCRVIINHVGVKQFIPRGLEDDKKTTLIQDDVVIFNIFPNGEKIDMRSNPPFFSIIPCPHCGTDNDRKHDAKLHVNRNRFGIDETLIQSFAKANECSAHHAFLFLKFGDKRFQGPIKHIDMSNKDTEPTIKIAETVELGIQLTEEPVKQMFNLVDIVQTPLDETLLVDLRKTA